MTLRSRQTSGLRGREMQRPATSERINSRGKIYMLPRESARETERESERERESGGQEDTGRWAMRIAPAIYVQGAKRRRVMAGRYSGD